MTHKLKAVFPARHPEKKVECRDCKKQHGTAESFTDDKRGYVCYRCAVLFYTNAGTAYRMLTERDSREIKEYGSLFGEIA